jgi:D-alanyl-D-alanine carboxypeptidase/D-alanyl-D-alanine-endopeptidase (penicillin-binding protein 4)
VSRRLLATAVAIIALASPAATAAQPTQNPVLQRQLARALHVPHVAPARSGAIALDLMSGDVVFSQNDTRPLAPASNEKLPLTYAALVRLGPTYRIDTEVLGTGGLDGTTWNGSLVLKGNGDPTLSTWGLRALAAQVKAAGIRSVTKGIIGDESTYDARRTVAGWRPSFYLNESPPLSALVLNRSRIGGYISGTPALSAALAFRDVLRKAGIAVAGPVRVGPAADWTQSLATISSPTLATMIRFMDHESDNFTAEMLLKQLGLYVLDRGTSAAGASVVTQTLADAGVPIAGVRIVDGSGLSLLDRLTARAIGKLLEIAWSDQNVAPSLLAALPVAGVNGTMQDRLRQPPARGRVLAKTGTTDEASSLSGYVPDRYAFAIVQNGHPVSSYWARLAQDRFAQVLAAQ